MSAHARRRRLAAALWVALAAAGCKAEDPRLSPGGLYGAELNPPRPKPEFTLAATDSSRFDFRARTDGYLTLLFFGYTHCPDVCPVHMANLGAVMKKLPAPVTERIRVVFVTTDPARDTPERLARWLGNFDPSFIGLTGSQDEIRRAETAAGIPPAELDSAGQAGASDYTVGHAAFVLAYTPDNLLRAMYPFGTRQSDWAHDIPRLVQMTGPQVDVTDARVLAAPGAGVAAGYFTLHNRGDQPLTLESVAVAGVAAATLQEQRRAGNVVRVKPLGPIVIRPGKTVILEPGGIQLMLSGVRRPLQPGDTVRMTLNFEGQNPVLVEAPVRSYGEAG
ncbi:MAG TPA: SCO family protein [Gemmatimonadales bacterium]|jgi:protein SCO1/2|nr:SCO family protein [Gemmatimonadales bacterium]